MTKLETQILTEILAKKNRTIDALLGIVERVYAYERERQQKDDHHFHDEVLDAWGTIIDRAKKEKKR